MGDNKIYEILENKLDNKEMSLFLFDAPTGIGKTYSILEYIRNNYKDHKIFFIANQLKLLPTKDDILKNISEEYELKDQILYLPSIQTCFRNSFNINLIAQMPRDFVFTNEDLINKLEKIIVNISKCDSKEIKDIFIQNFNIYENEFRNSIKLYMERKKKKDGKNKSLKTLYQKEKWIIELYPSILLEEKNIIFLTTKKFFLPIDPLYKSAIILSNENFSNAILFIDEFDTTKQELLNIIIEQNHRNYRVECFRLYRALNEKLQKNPFKDHLISSNNCNYAKASEIIKNIEDRFKQVNSYFNEELDYNFKTINDFPNSKHFVFHDNASITISGDVKAKYFIYNHNESDGYNYIETSNIYGTKNIEIVFKYVIEAIQFFIKKMGIIVQDYTKYVLEHKDALLENFEEDKACSSIIDFLHLGEENTRFLVSKILDENSTKYKKRSHDNNYDSILKNPLDVNIDKRKSTYDFYQNGFSFVEVEDSYTHNLESKCYMYSYDLTPEKLIMSLTNRYKVVATSATCTYATVIQNYDLNYFRYVLKEHLHMLNLKETLALKKHFEDKTNMIYRNSNIIVEFLHDHNSIEKRNYMSQVLKTCVKDREQELISEHDSAFGSPSDKYLYSVLANIYQVYYKFASDSEIHSFLCFMPFFPNNKEQTKNVFSKTMGIITKSFLNVNYIILDSIEYQENYDNIKTSILEKGEKLFLISTYQTLGAGINLQYKITKDNIKFCSHLKEYIDKGEKDFDAIYLSKPTNIFPYPEQSLNDYKQLANFLYAIEYYRAGDVIPKKKSYDLIKNAFSSTILNKKHDVYIGNHNGNIDISYGLVKYLNQAIGRICRTEHKNTTIKIYSSYENAQFLMNIYDDLINRVNNKEFVELLNAAKLKCEKAKIEAPKPEKCKEINKNTNLYLRKLYCQKVWTETSIEKWKALRELVLKYPTATGDEHELIEKLYYCFPCTTKEYSFDNPYNLSKIANGLCHHRFNVSFEESRAYWFLERMEGLKDYFISKNYAIEFKENRYILSHGLFKRVYTAAIGEVIGKFILNKFDIEVSEISNPAIFEKFDFKLSEKVYIDFKNWSNNFVLDKDSQIRKNYNKVASIGAKTVFIVNIAQQGFNEIHTYTDIIKGLKIITIPWLYDTYKCEYYLKAIAYIKEELL